MSSFNVNCVVELSSVNNVHECGIDKSITWSNNGTHSSVQTYFLVRDKLTGFKPIYVTYPLKERKLIKLSASNAWNA